MNETPRSIVEWSIAKLGGVRAGWNAATIAARANVEMAELLQSTSDGAQGIDDQQCLDEIADVVIILCRLAHECGGDLWKAVEAKMKENRGE